MRPRITPQPDFARFRSVLTLERVCARPPLFDFHIDPLHQAAILGREPVTPADRVEFYRLAGYDYVHAPLFTTPTELKAALNRQREDGAATHGGNVAVIGSLSDFHARRWSWQELAEGRPDWIADQLDRIAAIADVLPPEMRLILHVADAFTFAWEMIGFDALCLASLEEPEFPAAVMSSLGEAVYQATRLAVERLGDRVGALLYSDDIAYTEGLMLGPDFFRANLIPLIARLAWLIQPIHAPLIYHSDGRLFPVFDDLARAGVRGIQPLEPKSMDPLEIQRRWPGRFCLIGNIDLDLMSRGTPDEVQRHVRQRIDALNQAGGYIVGVSNTVPHYVRTENYVRMIETVYAAG